ncbi:GAF domain-containing protein [Persicobacter diffluens]|uniref:HAMP domain-containing protein n=1 Tax=Persicobacter diffluens TaxID=981 RepID=A0AAN4VYY1_9BACT|nr:hypothetical protein PEDI_31610 [Persicobacter diffluens]
MDLQKRSLKSAFIQLNIVILIFGVTILLGAFWYLGDVMDSNDRYVAFGEPIEYTAKVVKSDAMEVVNLLYGLSVKDDAEKIQVIKDRLYSIEGHIKGFEEKRTLGLDPQFDPIVLSIQRDFKALNEVVLKGAELRDPNFIEEQVVPKMNQFGNHINDLSGKNWEVYGSRQSKIFAGFGRFQIGMIASLVIFLSVIFLFVWQLSKRIVRYLHALETEIVSLSKGNLPKPLKEHGNELDTIVRAVNVLNTNLRQVKEFALEVGERNFTTKISVFEDKGEMGESLIAMRDSLKRVAAEEQIRNWQTEGVAKFESLIRELNKNIDLLADEFVRALCKYIGANQAFVFVAEENEKGDIEYLKLRAAYAFDRKKYVEKEVYPGNGLVGQCYLEQAPIFLSEIPQNYLKITSGLGDASPSNILLQPMIFNDRVEGILELATFTPLTEAQRSFIARICESMASAISTARTNERTQKILKESQLLTEQLRAQEEELRQNSEELLATQEGMSRRIEELEQQLQATERAPVME